ncbi:MAG: hypothetical protein J0H82_26515 [Alphaproteobacteria bacterium]|jgi:hypothetical protein|nr:hypothetical protein [Alphaproteobacteria bacterium]
MLKVKMAVCHEYVEDDGDFVMFTTAKSFHFGSGPVEITCPQEKAIRYSGEYRGWTREEIRDLVYAMRDLPEGKVPDDVAEKIREVIRVAPYPDHVTPDWHPQSATAQNSPLRELSDACVAACAARIQRLDAMHDREDYRHRGASPWNIHIEALLASEWQTAARLTGLRGDCAYRAIQWYWDNPGLAWRTSGKVAQEVAEILQTVDIASITGGGNPSDSDYETVWGMEAERRAAVHRQVFSLYRRNLLPEVSVYRDRDYIYETADEAIADGYDEAEYGWWTGPEGEPGDWGWVGLRIIKVQGELAT